MAERIEAFTVDIPAATAITSALVTPLSFNQGIVSRMEIVVPPGPSGLVGFRIRHSGEVIIPHGRSGWLVADAEKMDWSLEGYPTGNAWDIEAYNLDGFDHSIYMRIHVNETGRSSAIYATIVPIAPGGTAENDDDSLALADS